MSQRIDLETVQHVARLARIKLDDQDLVAMQSSLSAVLDYFEVLKSLDTDSVELPGHTEQAYDALRTDDVRPSLGAAAVLHNSVDAHGDFFSVPKILHQSE